ncbi:MAG: ribosomal protein L13e [Candidatus Bathyarchaeales archaeon]
MMALKPKVFKKDGKQRLGKGFSREELKKAGISLKDALKLGIPIDARRRTAHQENVEAIKGFLESLKGKPRRKVKSKK